MNLPACEHRSGERKDGNFYCSHPKVFTAGFIVSPEFCSTCRVYQIKLPPRDTSIPAPTAPSQEGTKRDKFVRWAYAMIEYWEKGSPKTTKEEYVERLAICTGGCEYYLNNFCTHPHCGCRLQSKALLRGKLSMATQQCPRSPPLWHAIKREGTRRQKLAARALRALVAKVQGHAKKTAG